MGLGKKVEVFVSTKKVFLAVALLAVFSGLVFAADPNGAATYGQGDTVAGVKTAVNFSWTLIAAFLVFFMQAGFALLGAGSLRTKSVINYWTKSYLDFSIGAIAFFAIGFALMFGGSKLAPGLDAGNSIIGWSGFFLTGEAYDVSTMVFWLFQMVFAATAATIVAGAVAERMKLQAYLVYTVVVTAVIYSIYGHWMWGGGWLSTLPFGVGARDFAGSGVVHAVGGLLALVGAWMVGPRIGKFNRDGSPNSITPHNVGYIVLGTFVLFFGWFGFNPGSTLAASDLRIAAIAVNTFLAGAAGAVAMAYYNYFTRKKVDTAQVCNAALAGLVGITAPCAYVAPWAAVVIGVISAFVMLGSAWFVENKLKVDDAVGAVGVHAGGGLWGLIAVGIFADGTYGGVKGLILGETGQMLAQLIDVGAVLAWALVTGYVLFKLVDLTIGLRVSREVEIEGLDPTEHGYVEYAKGA